MDIRVYILFETSVAFKKYDFFFQISYIYFNKQSLVSISCEKVFTQAILQIPSSIILFDVDHNLDFLSAEFLCTF